MNYHEFVYTVLLLLTLGHMVLPEAHLTVVVAAILLCAIRRENTFGSPP